MISKENIIEKILDCSHWDDQLTPILIDCGFQEPTKAWKNLIDLAKATNFKKLYPLFFFKIIRFISAFVQCRYSLA